MPPLTPRPILSRLLATDFPSFIARAFATADPGAAFLPGWHIDLIAEHLEACRRGEIKRLIINMPPRALKSVCVSVAWPAWLLGHDPAVRIMAASYASGLAVTHSVACREVMTQGWYRALFPGTILSSDQNEKHKFATTRRGQRIATSVGGTVTGEGGNFLILDDPLSAEQAESATQREHVNRWFEHTFATRLDDKGKGVIVLVMQRLHEGDLSGHLLTRGGWTHLCLPALAPEAVIHDFGRVCILREEGEPLHEAREDRALVEQARRELGTRAFAAQYQQQPLPEEGGMVRGAWFGRYDALPEAEFRITQSWDTAIKAAANNDASACLTFAEHEGVSYLLDALTLRAEYPDLKREVQAQAARFSPHAILIEDKASGQQLLQDLKRETHLPLIAGRPTGDKVTRFAGVSAMIEAGRVKLPNRAHWLHAFEAEILAFPGGRHDDQVDALTQYLDWLRARASLMPGVRGFGASSGPVGRTWQNPPFSSEGF